MTEQQNISPSEWEVMEILWEESPLPAAEVARRLEETRHEEKPWSIKTVRTFLSRLVGKKCLRQRDIEGIWHFEPAVDRGRTICETSRNFLDRFFDGTLASMIAHFVRQDDVSPAELDELRRMLQGESGSESNGKGGEQ